LSFELVEISPESSAIARRNFLDVGINDFDENHYHIDDNAKYLPLRKFPNGPDKGSDRFFDTRLIFRNVISASVVMDSNKDDRFLKFTDVVRSILNTTNERICLFLDSSVMAPLCISSVSWWGGLPATKMQVTSEDDETFSLMVHIRRKEKMVAHNIHVCTTSEKKPPTKKECLKYISVIAGSDKKNAIPSALEYAHRYRNVLERIHPELTADMLRVYPLMETYLRQLQHDLFEV